MASEEGLPAAFEDVMKELTRILERLEAGDLSLEESVRLYERGALLTRHGQEMLTQAQLKIDKLMRMGISGIETKPYGEGS